MDITKDQTLQIAHAQLQREQKQADNVSPSVSRHSGFRSVREYRDEINARSAKKAYWDGVLREGEISFLVGRAMAGKSTFAFALTRALYFGLPLLERKCTKAKVGYMALERNGVTVAQLFDAWEMEDVALLDEIGPSDRARFIEDEIHRLNLEVVIVDHLQNLARVPDSNDYATVSNALAPYTAIAKKTGCHIMLLHHQGKTRREGEINVMGSEAFRAAADVLIEATAHGGSHFICAQVRGGIGDLRKTRVTINLDTGEAEGIDAHQFQVGDASVRIVKYLDTQPEALNANEIQEALGLKRETVLSALAEAVTAGTINRSGAGKRGDPVLYFRSQHAQGTAGTESQNGEILNGAARLFRSQD